MTQEKTAIEGNRLIAEFMGKNCVEFHGMLAECEPDGSPFDYDPISWLNYDRDWSLLMPAIQKWDRFVMFTDVRVNEQYEQLCDELDDIVTGTYDIKEIYPVFVKCIEWYNQNKAKP